MRPRVPPTSAPRRDPGPIDWSRSRHEAATNPGQIGRWTRRKRRGRILTAINPGLLPAFDDRGEASVVVMYCLLARGELIVFLEGEQP